MKKAIKQYPDEILKMESRTPRMQWTKREISLASRISRTKLRHGLHFTYVIW
jgi:hypothetical protein